jgi:hypothetical protein
MILTGITKDFGKKTCPSTTLFTTSPTWTDLGTNLGLCSDSPLNYNETTEFGINKLHATETLSRNYLWLN